MNDKEHLEQIAAGLEGSESVITVNSSLFRTAVEKFGGREVQHENLGAVVRVGAVEFCALVGSMDEVAVVERGKAGRTKIKQAADKKKQGARKIVES